MPSMRIQLVCQRRIWSSQRFIEKLASCAGSAARRAYRSMNARAMPISSRMAAESDWVCFCANSPRMREERSATSCAIRDSSAVSTGSADCIAHDAIGARRPPGLAGVVKIVQVGYRLAHGEERLVRVELAAKEHRQQIARAFRAFLQALLQFLEPCLVVRLQ